MKFYIFILLNPLSRKHTSWFICLYSGITYRGRECGILTRYPDILTRYPDTDLAVAKELMGAKGIKQLPVVKRGRERPKDRKRRIVAVLDCDSILQCLRFLIYLARRVLTRVIYLSIYMYLYISISSIT